MANRYPLSPLDLGPGYRPLNRGNLLQQLITLITARSETIISFMARRKTRSFEQTKATEKQLNWTTKIN